MVQIIIDASLLLISIVIVLIWYLPYVKKHFGKLPSISASAKHFKIDGRSPLFYLFIIGLVIPMIYLAYNYYMIIAGMLLLGIGIITGYNPALKENKLQDSLHIVFTDTAIALFLFGIIINCIWDSIIVILVLIPSIIMLIKKVEYKTWKIEVLVIITVYISVFIHRVLLPLINYLR